MLNERLSVSKTAINRCKDRIAKTEAFNKLINELALTKDEIIKFTEEEVKLKVKATEVEDRQEQVISSLEKTGNDVRHVSTKIEEMERDSKNLLNLEGCTLEEKENQMKRLMSQLSESKKHKEQCKQKVIDADRR